MIADLRSRNENEFMNKKYGSEDIIRKQRLTELSFLDATLRIDLYQVPLKYF